MEKETRYALLARLAFENSIPKLKSIFPFLKINYGWEIKQSHRSNSVYINIYADRETLVIRISDHLSDNYPKYLLENILSCNGDFILNKVRIRAIEQSKKELGE